MEKNLILTGWGYPDYVASAAIALKAMGGRAAARYLSVGMSPSAWSPEGKFREDLPERTALKPLTAKLENGILTVVIKKRAESQPREIEIQ